VHGEPPLAGFGCASATIIVRLIGHNDAGDRRWNFLLIYYSGAIAAMHKAFSISYHPY
jgi:hypothetical protein